MSWKEPLEADARLAAQNAVKIRAALKQSVNSKTMFEAYQATQPQSTGNLAQTRARARAWAIINVRVNMETLKLILLQVWATGFLLGDLAAAEQIAEATRANRRKSAEINKAEAQIGIDIDWATWKPGDKVSALLLKPPRAFQRLLEQQGVTIKEITNTTLRDIGNAIGEAVELGLSAKQAAKLINRSLANPARSLMIAITESNRAMSAATAARYQQAGLEQMEWTTFDPCDICARNDGTIVQIGAPFPSGHTRPPAHPHCRCALLPVIPDMQAANYTGGSIAEGSRLDAETPYASRRFEIGQDEDIYSMMKKEQGGYIGGLSKEELRAVAGYQAEGTYDEVNNYLRGKGKITPENRKLIQTLDKVIADSSFDYNLTVYRGISDDTGAFSSLKIGDTILEKGYVSTSPNPAVAEAFANSTVIEGKPIVLEIEVPFGQPALASDVASNRLFGVDQVQDDPMMIDITGFTRLNEVTLPRNTALEVTEIVEKENARYIKARIKP